MKVKVFKCVTILILLCACLCVIKMQNRKINQNSQVINEVNEIDDEKDKLNKELEELENTYKEESYGKAGISFVIDQMDNTVFSFIYPLLNKNGYKAVIAIDLTHFPGDEDCISKEDFQMLMDEGWSFCIKWNGKDDFKEYMDSMMKRLTEEKMKAPQTLYVERNYYSEDLKAQANAYEIRNIIHHGEAEKNLVSVYKKQDNCWEIGALGYGNESIQTYINSAIDKGGCLILSIGTHSSDELYNVSSMNSVLNNLKSCEQEEKIMVDTIGNIKKYKADLAKDQNERDQSYQEATEEVKDEIDKLDQERANQTSQMNK